MRRTASFLLASLLVAAAARAQDAAPVETRWYGWQIMLADAAGVALIVAGARNDKPGLGWAGAITLATVSPLLHLAHHAPGDAATSLLVRTVPFGLSVIVYVGCSNHEGCLPIPAFGLLLSGAGAVVDWIFLSTERVEPRISFSPIVPLDRRRGGGAALALRF